MSSKQSSSQSSSSNAYGVYNEGSLTQHYSQSHISVNAPSHPSISPTRGSPGFSSQSSDTIEHLLPKTGTNVAHVIANNVTQNFYNQGPFNDEGSRAEEWTKLSDTVYMFKKEPMRPNANVYRGKQLHANGEICRVAVKLLKETESCLREVDILLKLVHHPNIVKILESGKLQTAISQVFIVMELCLQNLDDFINENPTFNLLKAVSFFKQITSAINFIHGNNITHRDLKPSNILLALDGETVKVSDFGISRKIEGGRSLVTVTHPGAGTEGFKAPELYRGERRVGYEVDVFSLGICAYYIMTHGKHPFGKDHYDWASNIIGNKNCNLSQIPVFPPPNAHKRSEILDLLGRMLKPDPKDRPTSLQVKDDAFFKDSLYSKSVMTPMSQPQSSQQFLVAKGVSREDGPPIIETEIDDALANKTAETSAIDRRIITEVVRAFVKNFGNEVQSEGHPAPSSDMLPLATSEPLFAAGTGQAHQSELMTGNSPINDQASTMKVYSLSSDKAKAFLKDVKQILTCRGVKGSMHAMNEGREIDNYDLTGESSSARVALRGIGDQLEMGQERRLSWEIDNDDDDDDNDVLRALRDINDQLATELVRALQRRGNELNDGWHLTLQVQEQHMAGVLYPTFWSILRSIWEYL